MIYIKELTRGSKGPEKYAVGLRIEVPEGETCLGKTGRVWDRIEWKSYPSGEDA